MKRTRSRGGKDDGDNDNDTLWSIYICKENENMVVKMITSLHD